MLIDAQTPGGPISTGVMVLYAGAESFTLMTPAGHPEAGWVTFSSYVEEGCTFAQVQVMARAGDPLYESGVLARRFQTARWDMDACAHGAGGRTWHERRGENGQNAPGPQAPVGAGLEHLVQRTIANPVVSPIKLLGSINNGLGRIGRLMMSRRSPRARQGRSVTRIPIGNFYFGRPELKRSSATVRNLPKLVRLACLL